MTTLKNCAKCKKFEGKDPKPPLCNIAATEPMDLIHIDLVGLEMTVDTRKTPVVKKVLVVVNHFSCYVQAYNVPDKRAFTITKCLYDKYFRHFGFPQCLMSDQGKEFCNTILNELCYYLNVKKL